MSNGKIIILSAPSGSGKSTIISHLIQHPELNLGFSVSATCRNPRGEEKHGVEYYFLSHNEFMDKVRNGEFVEWEEVYPGCCYGTLTKEVERVTGSGRNLIMDVDVKGAMNIKKAFGSNALAIFIKPPSTAALKERLMARGTDNEETIGRRLAKAEYELGFADGFDQIVVNDSLPEAVDRTYNLIKNFINN